MVDLICSRWLWLTKPYSNGFIHINIVCCTVFLLPKVQSTISPTTWRGFICLLILDLDSRNYIEDSYIYIDFTFHYSGLTSERAAVLTPLGTLQILSQLSISPVFKGRWMMIVGHSLPWFLCSCWMRSSAHFWKQRSRFWPDKVRN